MWPDRKLLVVLSLFVVVVAVLVAVDNVVVRAIMGTLLSLGSLGVMYYLKKRPKPNPIKRKSMFDLIKLFERKVGFGVGGAPDARGYSGKAPSKYALKSELASSAKIADDGAKDWERAQKEKSVRSNAYELPTDEIVVDYSEKQDAKLIKRGFHELNNSGDLFDEAAAEHSATQDAKLLNKTINEYSRIEAVDTDDAVRTLHKELRAIKAADAKKLEDTLFALQAIDQYQKYNQDDKSLMKNIVLVKHFPYDVNDVTINLGDWDEQALDQATREWKEIVLNQMHTYLRRKYERNWESNEMANKKALETIRTDNKNLIHYLLMNPLKSTSEMYAHANRNLIIHLLLREKYNIRYNVFQCNPKHVELIINDFENKKYLNMLLHQRDFLYLRELVVLTSFLESADTTNQEAVDQFIDWKDKHPKYSPTPMPVESTFRIDRSTRLSSAPGQDEQAQLLSAYREITGRGYDIDSGLSQEDLKLIDSLKRRVSGDRLPNMFDDENLSILMRYKLSKCVTPIKQLYNTYMEDYLRHLLASAQNAKEEVANAQIVDDIVYDTDAYASMQYGEDWL